MRLKLLILLFLVSFTGKSQSSYSGHLGKHPITLVLYNYSDGVSLAYYVYDQYDNPITINGNLENGDLKLVEKDKHGMGTATLIFEDFDERSTNLHGNWISADATKTFPIILRKDFEIGHGDNLEWNAKALLQSNSTSEHYFKTIITKEKGQFYARITGVKIFEKGTDKLIQTIALDCQLFGIDNVMVGDYNFDGIEDFSVFESSYAGPNTSSIYLLRDLNSNKYQVSNFSGTSLEFDKDAKLIYEHNQCCGGNSHMTATYKVVDNEMILIEKKCLEYDDEMEDFIETDCE
jgi:hypothetical protein